MPKFIIERELPGAGSLSEAELRRIAGKSCEALQGDLGEGYHWVQSFVVDDKVYCVHIAPSEEAVRKHAQVGGFPADRISEVTATIDPATAEGAAARA
ncbi:MAG: DUF4242 domain-containing protein [Gemmatimonadales bacterium]|nr:MAG: DUF4242 domain-containing protein [Gemmatimonadales bacterium]